MSTLNTILVIIILIVSVDCFMLRYERLVKNDFERAWNSYKTNKQVKANKKKVRRW